MRPLHVVRRDMPGKLRGGALARHQDYVAAVLVWLTVLCVVVAFGGSLGAICWYGIDSVSWEFLTSAPTNAGRGGGIAPMLVSTVLVIGVCMATALPVALGTAILLTEFVRAVSVFGRTVRIALDVLAATPSIVFGLFGNAFFCKALGMGFSILAGGLTLACMILPIVTRAAMVGLSALPHDYRLCAVALGLSRSTVLWNLVIPYALPTLIAGALLGVSRATAETAALIFTSGYVDRMPESLSDSGRTLSVHIYDLSMNVPGGDANAYGSAVVLVALLLLTNFIVTRKTYRKVGTNTD